MNSKITLSIFIAFTSSFWLRASLDDILAPLPLLAEVSPVLVAEVLEEEVLSPVVTEASVSNNEVNSGIPVNEVEFPTVDEAIFPISNESLLEAIEDQINAHLRPAGKISLAPMRALPDLSSHSQPFEVNLSRLPGRLSKNTMYLAIQVENQEGIIGNWDIPFKPALYSEVWFAKRYLRERELASASDFEARQVDLLYEPDAVVATLEVLQQHEYSRDIRPGQPLNWSDLAERSLVRKGQLVDVIAYQGMIEIAMRAKADQDGVRGEMVFLNNLESGKKFTGEVIGEGRVQVTF